MQRLVSFNMLLVLLGLVLTVGPARGQRVRAYVLTDSVAVGERFSLALVAEHGIMTEALFPDVRADSAAFGDLTALTQTDRTTRYGGAARPGVKIDSAVYEVTTFALDSAQVPPLAVRFARGPDTAAARSAPLLMPVRSVVPPGAQGLRGMAPPAEFPRPLWPYVLLALAALLLLAMLGYYLWRRRQQPEPEPAPQPRRPAPVSAFEEAQRRLRTLEATTDWTDPQAAKAFYVELVDVLRQYLTRRLGVPARELTTDELLTRLRRNGRRRPLPDAAHHHLTAVLRRADLAKFADARPPEAQRRAALREARALLEDVEATHRPPRPSPAETTEAAPTEAAPAEPT